ncbi:MAG: hypothetical protein HY711_09500 [Candidatus Melainabacteria bacterium]|nr:hypothetical protein [Candidatus Melainabacteria bacterium]
MGNSPVTRRISQHGTKNAKYFYVSQVPWLRHETIEEVDKVKIHKVSSRGLIATILLLVLTWTITLLHDVVEIGLASGLAAAEIEEPAHHAGHFHYGSDAGTPVIAAPEAHGHDPSVLNGNRDSQFDPPRPTTTRALSTHVAMNWLGMCSTLCNACKQRPPPYSQQAPTYLLYHAMLI